ncbi:hypothetical protein [Algoriphagus taiwanensis]|uniref:DUF4252 domain-containing protein n=1 Tax=Algoriphagus taiwanensis TaxID=1445656 RepID=A0ABQ6PZ91_9BACT|nr:hypothetical protein Ataiwa_15400 [Algoriphagus taiwanensis]
MKSEILKLSIVIFSLSLMACGSGTENTTSENLPEQAIDYQNKALGDWDACAGMDEDIFRKIFEVPDSYQLMDMSSMNVSKGTCLMFAENDGQKFGIMVQMMSTPSTYKIMAAGILRDFEKVPEELRVKGLGKEAAWVERENRKVSGITVVGDDHVVAIMADHYNTRDRDELQPMLEKYYRHWLKSH